MPKPLPIPKFPSQPPTTPTIQTLFNCKRRKKLLKKLKSPRLAPIQKPHSQILPQFEQILDRDAQFRFLHRSTSFLRNLPNRALPIPSAHKFYQQLGIPRGRKLTNYIFNHSLIFKSIDNNFTFTELMDILLQEELDIMERTMDERIKAVRKLLMMTKEKRVALAKLYHVRGVLGLPDDFRDRVREYEEFLRVVVDEKDGRHVLELVKWDDELAVSALERDFVIDEDRVRKTFKFPIQHGKSLNLNEDDEREMNAITTLPLISPYSDGSKFNLWSLEAEKFRVGVIHEFLSLTLEKRAMIHHIVEFKEEFNLTKHTYQMLLKQPKAFYLAGTEMNWGVFLRDAYRDDGTLIEKDPLVIFYEKLQKFALMNEGESTDRKMSKITSKK